MEDLALAFFDSPLYIHRSTQTSPASRSQNIPVLAPLDSRCREDQPSAPFSEHNMRPDASTLDTHNSSLQGEQHPPSESGVVSPFNGVEANVLPVSPSASDTPSSTALTGNTSKPLTDAVQSSIKSKPFIPRSYDGNLVPLAAGPVFPSTMVHPVKVLPVASCDVPSIRAVSLPGRHVPGMDAALGHSANMFTLPPGSRIVSLPESTIFPNKLTVSSLPPSHHPSADDMPLLIDFSSPQPQQIALSPSQSSPNGSILIHSSFVKSSSRSPSPCSTRDCSQSESESIIFVNNPLVGCSPSFLRRPQSPASWVVRDVPSPANARLVKLTSSQSAQQGWIPVSPPRPIPALHGPPSLPYARCPSGAEGVMISEQSSLPRMIWGLDEQTHPAPKTPHLQSSTHDIRVSTVASGNNSSNAYTPASTMVNTPASTFVATPSTNTSTPPSTTDAQYKSVDHTSDHNEHGGFNRIARDSGVASKGGSEHLGSPLELATPGGYTEYHYVESAQWQEFVPPPRVEPAAHSENLQRAPSVYTSSAMTDDPVQRSHSHFLPRPALTLRNDQPRNSYPPGTLIPPYVQRHLPAISIPQYQLRPKLRDLTQITGLISNADMTSLTAPELWSASLRQFWNDTFAQLGPPATAFAATLNPLAPLHPPGIPIPPAAQRSGPTPSSRRSSGDSDANSTDKHEPYAGALDNPRSVPIARLRRKLTTVAEEKDIEGLSRQRESAIEENETRRTPTVSLEAETQTAFGGLIEEGLRVRLPQRSDTGPAGSNNRPATRVITSKASSPDTRRRNAGRRSGSIRPHLPVLNTPSKDPTKENRRSFSSSVNNSGPKQTKRQPRSLAATQASLRSTELSN